LRGANPFGRVRHLTRRRLGDAEGEYVARHEPEILPRQPLQASHRQTRGDHEHHGERDFAHHQQTARCASATCGDAPRRSLAKRVARLGSRDVNARQNAGEKPARQRDSGGEGKDSPVEADCGKAREVRGGEHREESQQPDRKQQAHRAADN
jgi:hypothetical protein